MTLLSAKKNTNKHNSLDIADCHIYFPGVNLPDNEVIHNEETDHYLQILSFGEDEAILQKFETKYVRKPIEIAHIQSQPEVIERIRAAWEMEAEEQLIATANVENSCLYVMSCGLRTWKIPFDSIPALECISINERPNFEIDEDGSFLYWESVDVHIDLEALRAAVDPELRAQLMFDKINYSESFCQAIAEIRKSRKLTQEDIPKVSSRQVRRIEKGSIPKLATLKHLAEAHGFDLNSYLEEIARTMKLLQNIQNKK